MSSDQQPTPDLDLEQAARTGLMDAWEALAAMSDDQARNVLGELSHWIPGLDVDEYLKEVEG